MQSEGAVSAAEWRAETLALPVTAVGMVSALGTDAATSCAAARAGISRAAPLPAFQVYSEGDWGHIGVVGHALHEYARGFEGFGRLVRLASGALADLLSGASLQDVHWPRTALCLGVSSAYFQAERARQPEARAEDTEADVEQIELVKSSLLARVCALNGMGCDAPHRFLFMEDQCGFAHALFKAQQLLASGEVDRCIVGGVDACTDGAAMASAHLFHVLKTADQAAGYQPGEAAGFVMLESTESARARGASVLGQVDAASWGVESVARASGKPALGVGMAGAIQSCLAKAMAPSSQVDWMLGDLNGDAFRANDWGYALVRLMPDHPALGERPLVLPAESFGEIGAATGPVAVCMAMRAFARGYAPGRRVLVWLASYRGYRAAFTLQQA